MRYFNYQEFEDSATARRDGIDNSLTPVARRMVTILVEMLLDPLRRVWGPFLISLHKMREGGRKNAKNHTL